jgi:O-succinylbenzoic acid--CoA ligase
VVPSGEPPTLEDLRTHVKQHHPAFMAPKRLQLVEILPRTALGKLRRT